MYFRIFKIFMLKSDTNSVFQIPKFWIHLYILSSSIPIRNNFVNWMWFGRVFCFLLKTEEGAFLLT